LPAFYALAFRVALQPDRMARSLDGSALKPSAEEALQPAE
jgi:hypothetical protein